MAAVDEKVGLQGRKESSMAQRHRERMDALPVTVSCAFCDWSFSGTVAEGRAASLEHRQQVHPDNVIYKKRRKPKAGEPGHGQANHYKPTSAEQEASRLAAEKNAGQRRAAAAKQERGEQVAALTREEALQAAVRWMGEHDGKPPTAKEWQQPASVRGDYPQRDTAKKAYGGDWKAFIREALALYAASVNGGQTDTNILAKAVVDEATDADAFEEHERCVACGRNPRSQMPSVEYEGLCGSCRADAIEAGLTVAELVPPTAWPAQVRAELEAEKGTEETVIPPTLEEPVVESKVEEEPFLLAHHDEDPVDPVGDKPMLVQLAEELEYAQEQTDGWYERLMKARDAFCAHPVIQQTSGEWGLDTLVDENRVLAAERATRDGGHPDRALAILIEYGVGEEYATKWLAKVDPALPAVARARKALRVGWS